MTVTVEIPSELQPLVAAAVAHGRFANEQELVSDILRVAVPVLEDHERLRREVEMSVAWRIGVKCARRILLGYGDGSAKNTTNPADASNGTRLLERQSGRERAGDWAVHHRTNAESSAWARRDQPNRRQVRPLCSVPVVGNIAGGHWARAALLPRGQIRCRLPSARRRYRHHPRDSWTSRPADRC